MKEAKTAVMVLPRIFQLVRIPGLGAGLLLSFLALYNWAITFRFVLRRPFAVLPEAEVWSEETLRSALASLHLPVGFFAIYSLVFSILFTLSFLICGWLILWKKSGDWFGLFLGNVFLIWADGVGVFYSAPELDPLVSTVRSYLAWVSWPGLFLLLYFFPSGHVTPRWTRWFTLPIGALIVYGLATTALNIKLVDFSWVFPVIFLCLLVGGYAQVARYRQAGPVERQQIALVVMAQLFFVLFFLTLTMMVNLLRISDPATSSPSAALLVSLALLAGGSLSFAGVPVSITVAIMQYRLWDIDVILRRTLQYSFLTGILAITYFGSIIVLQNTVGTFTGDVRSPLVTVISTLVIAALFNPLRSRTQRWIDRRFFRGKYNAEQELGRFARAARDEVDFNKLNAAILDVAEKTLRPERASLWVREPEDRKKKI